jgi:hypothetical protein
MNLSALFDHLIPLRMREPVIDDAGRDALEESRTVAAQARQFQLEADLYHAATVRRQRQRRGNGTP